MFAKPKKAEKKPPKPLKRTPLTRKTPLKRSQTPLKRTQITPKPSGEKPKKTVSKKKSQVYKPSYPYASIFTDDLNKCYITHSDKTIADIHVHHIFGASNKANSEKYHFLVPLRADWHDMADYGVHHNRELDLKFKRKCQDYWLEHYGTKEEFIEVFGKWW